MKRFLLVLMLMIMTSSVMKADEIIVGTATDARNLAPFLNSYQNSWLEMIYTAEEIGQACTIGNIAFQYVDGPTVETNEIRIYLAETTKSSFADKSEWTPENELTLVYSGTNVVIGDDAWETFELDTPFEYSGEKNLAVVVAKTANYYQLSLRWACYDSPNSIMFTGNVNGDNDTSFAQYPTADALAIYGKKPVMKLTEAIIDDAVEELTTSFNIYPNPVNDRLFIETEANVKEVAIYTLTGVMVGQKTTDNGQQTLSIDVTNYNSGIYFVKVVTDNGEVVKRFVKK